MNISGSSFIFNAYILSNENAINNISLTSSYYSSGSGNNYDFVNIQVNSGANGATKQLAITDIGNSLSGILTGLTGFIFPKSTAFNVNKNGFNILNSNSWTGYYTGYKSNNLETGYLSASDAGIFLSLVNNDSYKNDFYTLGIASTITGSGFYKNKIKIQSVNKQNPSQYTATTSANMAWASYSTTLRKNNFDPTPENSMRNNSQNICAYGLEIVTNIFFSGKLTDVYSSIVENTGVNAPPYIYKVFYSNPAYNNGISSGDNISDDGFTNSLSNLSNSLSGILYYNGFQDKDQVIFKLYPYDYVFNYQDYNGIAPQYPQTGFVLTYGKDFYDFSGLYNGLKYNLDNLNCPVWYRYQDLKNTYESSGYYTGKLMKIQKLNENSIFFQSYRSMPDIFDLSLNLQQPRSINNTTTTTVTQSGIPSLGYNFLVPTKIYVDGSNNRSNILRPWTGIDIRYNIDKKIKYAKQGKIHDDLQPITTVYNIRNSLSSLSEIFPDIPISPSFSGAFYSGYNTNDPTTNINIYTTSYRLGFSLDPNSFVYGNNFLNYTGFTGSDSGYLNKLSLLSFDTYRFNFSDFSAPEQLQGLINKNSFYIKNITLYSCASGNLLLDKSISPIDSLYAVDVCDNIHYNVNDSFKYNFTNDNQGALTLQYGDSGVVYYITGNKKNINFRNTTGIIPQNIVTGYITGTFFSTGYIEEMVSGYFYNPAISQITLRNLFTGYTYSGSAILQKDINVLSNQAITNSSVLYYGNILNVPIYMNLISSGIFYKTQNNFVYQSNLLTGYSYANLQITGGPSYSGYYQYNSDYNYTGEMIITGNLATGNIYSYWKMNETGSTRYDSLSRQNLVTGGTIGIVKTGAGITQTGIAAAFINRNGILQTTGGLPFSSTFTISVWAKVTGVDTSNYQLIFDCNSYPQLFIGPNSQPGLWWVSNTGPYYVTVPTSSPFYPQVNQWNHYICTATSTGIYLYINSQFFGSYLGNAGLPGNTFLTVGGRANIYSFNGFIDEMGMWTRELNGEEINTLYNNGLSRTYPFIDNPTYKIYPINTGIIYTGTGAFFYGNNFSISGNNILPAIPKEKIWKYNISTGIPAIQFVTGLSSAYITGMINTYSGVRKFTDIWDVF
jgi:hypothetical protein